MLTNEELETRLKALEKDVAALKKPKPAAAAVAPAEPPASPTATNADLDGPHGDDPVRRDPSAKYWEGESHVGDKLSACPVTYLDALVRYKLACAYMSAKDPAKAKYAEYDARDAARAKGWAARLRAGWQPPGGVGAVAQDDDGVGLGADEIPF